MAHYQHHRIINNYSPTHHGIGKFHGDGKASPDGGRAKGGQQHARAGRHLRGGWVATRLVIGPVPGHIRHSTPIPHPTSTLYTWIPWRMCTAVNPRRRRQPGIHRGQTPLGPDGLGCHLSDMMLPKFARAACCTGGAQM